MSRLSRQRLNAFLDMLAAERGAARNTLDAYERDVTDYLGFLGGKTPGDATAEDIRGFIRRPSFWTQPSFDIDKLRHRAETMEAEAANFYRRAASRTSDPSACCAAPSGSSSGPPSGTASSVAIAACAASRAVVSVSSVRPAPWMVVGTVVVLIGISPVTSNQGTAVASSSSTRACSEQRSPSSKMRQVGPQSFIWQMAHVIAVCVGGMFVVAGARLVSESWGYPMAGAPLPQGVVYLPICIGGALIVLFALEHLAATRVALRASS